MPSINLKQTALCGSLVRGKDCDITDTTLFVCKFKALEGGKTWLGLGLGGFPYCMQHNSQDLN